jgi:hypothetical protein
MYQQIEELNQNAVAFSHRPQSRNSAAVCLNLE